MKSRMFHKLHLTHKSLKRVYRRVFIFSHLLTLFSIYTTYGIKTRHIITTYLSMIFVKLCVISKKKYML